MRLFVGVAIEEHLRETLAELIAALRQRAAAIAPGAAIAWVGPERLHITLRFIGSVDAVMADAIHQALREPVAVAPFDAVLDGLGVFPPRGHPRVVWAGLAAGGDSLAALEQDISARLERLGLPRESRHYRPHLTLARVRQAANLRAATLLDGPVRRPIGRTRVDAITLYESRLSARGSSYVALHQIPLAAR